MNNLKKRDPRCKLSIKEELKAIKLYKNGFPLSKVAKSLNVSISCIQNAFRAHNFKARTHGEGTRLLHKHLTIKPPQNFPRHLKDKFRKLIAVFLLTDGYVKENGYTIGLISTDDILQRYFLALCKEEFHIVPTENSFKRKNKETALHSRDAYFKLFELSPSYKKAPRNTSVEEYLNDLQPSLSFLKDESLELLKECVRIAMSTEGSVSIEFPRNTIYPKLEFSCANPELCNQWKKIFGEVGIKTNIEYSKTTWSGIKGLKISDLKSIRNFIKIGSFIDGVKVTKKSKFFDGISKKCLLDLVWKMKMESFQFPQNLTREQKKKIIRLIIENSLERKKWWQIGVEKPKIESKLKKSRAKEEIIKFIRKRTKEKHYPPTRVKIEDKFRISLTNYFKSINDAYKKAGVSAPREIKCNDIINFVKNSAKNGFYPTWKDIEKEFHVSYVLYFKSIREIYQSAGVKYPRIIKKSAKKPFKTKDEGREAIKNYISKMAKKGILPSTKEVEEKVRVKLRAYFKNVDEAYKYARVPFKRMSRTKRAFLVSR